MEKQAVDFNDLVPTLLEVDKCEGRTGDEVSTGTESIAVPVEDSSPPKSRSRSRSSSPVKGMMQTSILISSKYAAVLLFLRNCINLCKESVSQAMSFVTYLSRITLMYCCIYMEPILTSHFLIASQRRVGLCLMACLQSGSAFQYSE